MSVLLAFVVVAVCNALVLAPYRAWRMLNPFRVEVEAGKFTGIFPETAFPRQSATLVVQNLSYRPRADCVLHVTGIVGFDDQHHALPRFVREFSLQAGEKQRIEFLYWTARDAPYINDPSFMMSGPIGWGWGGNVVTLPVGLQDIDLRIGVAGADAAVVACRVWVEGKTLIASIRPEPISVAGHTSDFPDQVADRLL